ncbi:myomegalin-like [Carassius gibelio]|uniref:myomegalin-like n=1 Tax=Carassius gibelio TaxID=101364 RepID=UPI002279B41C|nr:myomegalin-like [Carassius gibelio]
MTYKHLIPPAPHLEPITEEMVKNIELKVEVESLKQELQERQEQLDNALTTAGLTNQNEVEVQRRCEERQQEIRHKQEILETKVQLLQEIQSPSAVWP